MGCCFCKEAGPDQASEKISLLHTPHQDGIHDSVEQVRHQAVALAQHVCLDEEEAGPHHGEAGPGPDSKTQVVVSEKNDQAESTHKEEPAIVIPASASVAAAGVTRSPSHSCEPGPYMEVLSQSLARQNIVENATLRALWFRQNLEGPKLLHPKECWSGSIGTGRVDCGKVSSKLSSVSGQDGISSLSEDCIVTTTLGQDFQTRTRRFYSICSIDTNDLDHDECSQAQAAATCPGSSQTASPLQLSPPQLQPLPLTGASGVIPDLQVELQMVSAMPEGNVPMLTQAEDDSCVPTCDQMTLSVSSEVQTSKETSASFQENQTDRFQHSQPASESHQKVPHSHLEPDVTEQHIKEEDKHSLQRDDQVLAGQSEEDENSHISAIFTRVPSAPVLLSQCGSVEGPGDHRMMLTEQSVSSEFQITQETPATFREMQQDLVQRSQPASETPKEIHSFPESDVTEQQNQEEDHCSPQREDGVAAKKCEEDSEVIHRKTAEGPRDPPEPTTGPRCDEEETVPLHAEEEHPETPRGVSSHDEMVDACRRDELSSQLQDGDVQMELDQLDVHALTPSYEIHFPGQQPPGEEGVRELPSELLGEDQTWMGPVLEDGRQAWVQGAFPYNSSMACEWAWHTGVPQASPNSDAEVWTGCNYNVPQQPWLHLPNGQNHGLHVELAHLSVAEAQASESLVLAEAGELAEQLRCVLEFCLSREQLASDVYLQSQMDEDQYVSVATLAGLLAVERLGADLRLVTDVVQTLPYIQMSPCGHKVRANHSQYVLILREIPSSTPREEVEALFSDEKLPKFLSCQFVRSDYWFITFRSEADAYQAYKYLREEICVFQGKPIKARMKAKSTSFTPRTPANGFGPTRPHMLADHWSYLPPDAYDFTYPAWSDSGYSDCAETLELGFPAAPYFQPHAPRTKRGGARMSGSHQSRSQKASDEISASWRPARGRCHSRGSRRATGTPSVGGRSVNDDQRRREKLWSALKTTGARQKEPSTPPMGDGCPVELGVSNFPPLCANKTPEPAELLSTSADDITSEAPQRLSYAAICQKSSCGRSAPPVTEK